MLTDWQHHLRERPVIQLHIMPFGIVLDLAASAGTVKAFPNFDPVADAQKLWNAVKGPGTDEAALISILANRSKTQLKELCDKFKELYKEGLKTRLLEDLSRVREWRERMIVTSRVQTPGKELAQYFQWALKGSGTDEMALVELLATRSYDELAACWDTMGGKGKFIERIKDDVAPSEFLGLLLHFTNPPEELKLFSLNDASKFDATDPNMWGQLFARRAYEDNHNFIKEMEKVSGRNVEDLVKHVKVKKGRSLYEKAFLTLVEISQNVHSYFARRIWDSVHGPSTDDTKLIRVIVSRCEVDMVPIKEEFKNRYGMTLEAAVEDDTSGNYRRFLIALIT